MTAVADKTKEQKKSHQSNRILAAVHLYGALWYCTDPTAFQDCESTVFIQFSGVSTFLDDVTAWPATISQFSDCIFSAAAERFSSVVDIPAFCLC